MALLRTYKSFIAATLLAVYVFIATPVQFWHYHKSPGKQQAPGLTSATLAKSTGTSAEANCSICSHQYSSYYDDNSSPVLPSIATHPSQKGDIVFSFIVPPVFSLSNKGPPSLS